MKKSHIIALGVIAIAIAMIISTIGDASTYLSFKEAKDLAEKGNTKAVHVVGELPGMPRATPSGYGMNRRLTPTSSSFL